VIVAQNPAKKVNNQLIEEMEDYSIQYFKIWEIGSEIRQRSSELIV